MEYKRVVLKLKSLNIPKLTNTQKRIKYKREIFSKFSKSCFLPLTYFSSQNGATAPTRAAANTHNTAAQAQVSSPALYHIYIDAAVGKRLHGEGSKVLPYEEIGCM
jgi:hypothetical protein